MKRLLVALCLVVVACGGGAGETNTTGNSDTTAATVTTSGVTTTTTLAVTTSVAADAHPTFGTSWASVWPGDGATASYLVTRFDGSTVELPAVMEYGVEFRGSTVDRLIVGTAEPGHEGWALYFDRTTPWVLTVFASEVYETDTASGPSLTEMFVPPIDFDGTIGVGETFSIETTITLEFPGASPDTLGVSYSMMPATIEDSVTVPFGTVDGVMRLEAQVGGDFIGGLFNVTLWLDSELGLVRFEGAPAWDVMELVTPWA